MRYKLKKDEHHAAIAHELAEAGFFVADTSRLGNGFPDLCISRNGCWALVELKTKIGSKTALEQLKPNQMRFRAKAKGPIIAAHTASEVLYEFNLLIKRRGAYAL